VRGRTEAPPEAARWEFSRLSRGPQTGALFRNKLAAPVDLEIDMTAETCSELTATNIGLLQQGLSLVRRIPTYNP
jgi:hypothetical protein